MALPEPDLDPEPHPSPSAALGKPHLPLTHRAGRWYRVHDAGRDPLVFGTMARNRFDDPERQFGILYTGCNLRCCLLETFLSHTGAIISLAPRDLAAKRLASLVARQTLALVDLTGDGFARLGVDNRLAAGDRHVARAWSAAFHNHQDQPDGILYRARHHPALFCSAIYERARSKLSVLG